MSGVWRNAPQRFCGCAVKVGAWQLLFALRDLKPLTLEREAVKQRPAFHVTHRAARCAHVLLSASFLCLSARPSSLSTARVSLTKSGPIPARCQSSRPGGGRADRGGSARSKHTPRNLLIHRLSSVPPSRSDRRKQRQRSPTSSSPPPPLSSVRL